MIVRRSRLLAGVVPLLAAALLAAAGCSSPGGSTTAPSSPAPPPGSAAASGAAQTTYPLTITQPDGTKATITKAPTRIVTLDQPAITIDELLALGVVPIGGELNTAASGFGAGEFDSRGIPVGDSSKIKNFTSVGVPFTPDLEKIAALHPDLIVGYSGAGTSDLKQLEAIAPVVSVPLDYDPAASVQGIKRLSWYPAVATLAKVLNRQAQFNAFISRFQAAANAARPALKSKSVSMVVVLNNLSAIQVYGPGYYDGVTLSYLGVNVAQIPGGGAVQPDSNNDGTNLSLERVSELTGNYLMFATFAPGVTAKFLSSPLVRRLPSVRRGRVIDASTDTPLYGFPSVGCIEQLNLIPKLAQAFGKAGKAALCGCTGLRQRHPLNACGCDVRPGRPGGCRRGRNPPQRGMNRAARNPRPQERTSMPHPGGRT